VANVNTSLGTLGLITSRLDQDTRTVMSYLTDIKAFVYNTSSVFGAGDAQGSIIRGHLIVPLPAGGVLPNSLNQGRGDN
jgi:phospholipid/cholesterol/gamma-HCH transport system substrate-binding protein